MSADNGAEVEEIDLIGALTNALDKAVANAAEHSSSAQIAEALREIAENYLYDGDSDGPQPGYDELWDLAASVEDLRAEATTGAVIGLEWADTLRNDGTYEYTTSGDCHGTWEQHLRRLPARHADAGDWAKVDAIPDAAAYPVVSEMPQAATDG